MINGVRYPHKPLLLSVTTTANQKLSFSES